MLIFVLSWKPFHFSLSAVCNEHFKGRPFSSWRSDSLEICKQFAILCFPVFQVPRIGRWNFYQGKLLGISFIYIMLFESKSHARMYGCSLLVYKVFL
ncbi:hypothetical protein MKW92_034068 [Papaver armeniacum]|nr:hypothetical protein MKW92_034068 [Papaver armeniacum]